MASLLGAAYDSSDDDATTPQVATATPATKVVAAPEVNTEVWSLEQPDFFLLQYPLTSRPWN